MHDRKYLTILLVASAALSGPLTGCGGGSTTASSPNKAEVARATALIEESTRLLARGNRARDAIHRASVKAKSCRDSHNVTCLAVQVTRLQDQDRVIVEATADFERVKREIHQLSPRAIKTGAAAIVAGAEAMPGNPR